MGYIYENNQSQILPTTKRVTVFHRLVITHVWHTTKKTMA